MNPEDFIPSNVDLKTAYDTLGPLALYVVGMVVYAVLVFNFYRFLASKDIFQLNTSQYEESRVRWVRTFLHVALYIAKYLLLFPLVAFLGSAVLATLLAVLAKDQSVQTVVLVSMALVTAIRATSYYNEDLSRDLAKILPFALLGVFLINASYLNQFSHLRDLFTQAQTQFDIIPYYLAFVILTEFFFRVVSWVVMLVRRFLTGRPNPSVPPTGASVAPNSGAATAARPQPAPAESESVGSGTVPAD